MARHQMIIALAKVIIAAAWADGQVSHEELNSLKDLLFRIPRLNALDWAELDIYVESPVDAEERARLVEELKVAIASPADKQLAIETLQDLITADGTVTNEEQQLFEELKAIIGSVDASLVGGLSRLVRGSVQRRTTSHNREQFLDDFISNKVYYHVQRRVRVGEGELSLPDETLRKLSLAGALMAQVAHDDRQMDETEVKAIQQALQEIWHLGEGEAAFVTEVITSDVTRNLDYLRVAREFTQVCSPDELADFIKVLFQIAAADGKATLEETETIRNIARSLKLTHEQFIAAKLTLPRGKRSD
ncbi:MAG: TerB family tellurite resistance protein [Anaerolineae bacterium]